MSHHNCITANDLTITNTSQQQILTSGLGVLSLDHPDILNLIDATQMEVSH